MTRGGGSSQKCLPSIACPYALTHLPLPLPAPSPHLSPRAPAPTKVTSSSSQIPFPAASLSPVSPTCHPPSPLDWPQRALSIQSCSAPALIAACWGLPTTPAPLRLVFTVVCLPPAPTCPGSSHMMSQPHRAVGGYTGQAFPPQGLGTGSSLFLEHNSPAPLPCAPAHQTPASQGSAKKPLTVSLRAG